MEVQAQSSAILERVTSYTDIQKGDGYALSAVKFAGGIPLKVAVIAMATMEMIVCAIATLPAYVLKKFIPEIFSCITAHTAAAASAILDATKALAHVRAKSMPKDTTSVEPELASVKLKNAVAKSAAFLSEHKLAVGLVCLSAAVLIVTYYNYPALLEKLEAETAQPHDPNPIDNPIQTPGISSSLASQQGQTPSSFSNHHSSGELVLSQEAMDGGVLHHSGLSGLFDASSLLGCSIPHAIFL